MSVTTTSLGDTLTLTVWEESGTWHRRRYLEDPQVAQLRQQALWAELKTSGLLHAAADRINELLAAAGEKMPVVSRRRTIAAVYVETPNSSMLVSEGIAYLGPHDTYSKEFGEQLAVERALLGLVPESAGRLLAAYLMHAAKHAPILTRIWTRTFASRASTELVKQAIPFVCQALGTTQFVENLWRNAVDDVARKRGLTKEE